MGTIYLEGYWASEPEFLKLAKGKGKISMSYQAREAYMVLSSERPIDVEVLLDGFPLLRSQANQDIIFKDGRTYLTVDRDDMYYIVKTGLSEAHELTLVCSDGSLKVYAYTFG
jgi:hypothetical protein